MRSLLSATERRDRQMRSHDRDRRPDCSQRENAVRVRYAPHSIAHDQPLPSAATDDCFARRDVIQLAMAPATFEASSGEAPTVIDIKPSQPRQAPASRVACGRKLLAPTAPLVIFTRIRPPRLGQKTDTESI